MPEFYRFWLLRLVPPVAHGRWWCALGIFTVLFGVFYAAGIFRVDDAASQRAWPAALFFCVILAYVTPMFHYITYRTELAFDELAPYLTASSETVAAWRAGISGKSTKWVVRNSLIGVSLWLGQSWLLAGGFAGMAKVFTAANVDLVMAVAPLPVWLFTTGLTHALIDNARLFRRLANRVSVDLLDTSRLNPFGRMAVSSTLVVIGLQALFPIMWLGAAVDPWSTIPGLVTTTLALLYLFAAPTWPVHRALRGAKQRELRRLHEQIRLERQNGQELTANLALTALLVYRREVAGAAEWPFDFSIVARFGLYLVIVPLTWIGAALIENLVDLFIST